MADKTQKRLGDITISDAKIIFKNFSGKEGDFNPPGNRNFCVVLDEETADVLAADGWNVKRSESKEEGLPPLLYLPVAVKDSPLSIEKLSADIIWRYFPDWLLSFIGCVLFILLSFLLVSGFLRY